MPQQVRHSVGAHKCRRSSSCDTSQWQPLVLSRRRSLSVPDRSRLPREIIRHHCQSRCASTDEASQDTYSLTGHIADALAFSPCRHEETYSSRLVTKVAVIGGGPAGLCAAMALIQEQLALSGAKAASILPSLQLTIFEKRPEALRRQRVFVDTGRLPPQVFHELRLNTERLSELFSARGAAWDVPGASVELRVLELCLQQLLFEVCQLAAGSVSVRWEPKAFESHDLLQFHHVIGADGRRSAVRNLLMARISRVQLAICALEVEFAYNCHVEFLHSENVHVLKSHRYERWRPTLLYHKLRRQDEPEYVPLHRADYEAVQLRYRDLMTKGGKPYTTAFDSASTFLDLFASQPDLQESLRQALTTHMEDFDTTSPALITPVDLTLHRTPHLVSLTSGNPSLWLLGDAAVGLPVSKGCNLVYHMASAGRLAAALLTGSGDAKEADAYEAFVFDAWHGEAWSEGRHASVNLPTNCSKREGKFISS